MPQLIRFLGVGALATAVQFGLMVALVRWFDTGPVLASSVGFVCSALLNYQLNRVLTFASTVAHKTAMPRFAVVAGCGLVLNAAVMALLLDLLGLHYVMAQVAATCAVTAFNFLMSKHWTFARTVE